MVQLKGAFLRLVTVQYRNTSICLGDQVEVDYVTRSPCDGISPECDGPRYGRIVPIPSHIPPAGHPVRDSAGRGRVPARVPQTCCAVNTENIASAGCCGNIEFK